MYTEFREQSYTQNSLQCIREMGDLREQLCKDPFGGARHHHTADDTGAFGKRFVQVRAIVAQPRQQVVDSGGDRLHRELCFFTKAPNSSSDLMQLRKIITPAFESSSKTAAVSAFKAKLSTRQSKAPIPSQL